MLRFQRVKDHGGCMNDLTIYSKRFSLPSHMDTQDFLQYELPGIFRNQVIHIWRSAVGFYKSRRTYENLPGYYDTFPMNWFWDEVVNSLSREYGNFSLGRRNRNLQQLCEEYLKQTEDALALDIIELTFSLMDRKLSKLKQQERTRYGIRQTPEDAIIELNRKFQEHQIGYRFESGKILALHSEHIHLNITVPAIRLLNSEGFSGPEKEFLEAYEHYQYGRGAAAISEASNALESTIKAILHLKKMEYDQQWNANRLIQEFMKTGIIPVYQQEFLTKLTGVLQGLPTIRNNESAHGDGSEPKKVQAHLVEYALDLAATAIKFLVTAYKSGH